MVPSKAAVTEKRAVAAQASRLDKDESKPRAEAKKTASKSAEKKTSSKKTAAKKAVKK